MLDDCPLIYLWEARGPGRLDHFFLAIEATGITSSVFVMAATCLKAHVEDKDVALLGLCEILQNRYTALSASISSAHPYTPLPSCLSFMHIHVSIARFHWAWTQLSPKYPWLPEQEAAMTLTCT
jgi:hypothetical protein